MLSLFVSFVTYAICVYGNDSCDIVEHPDLHLGLLLATLVIWLVCQYTTFTINVPLNNRVQTLDTKAMDNAKEETKDLGLKMIGTSGTCFVPFSLG